MALTQVSSAGIKNAEVKTEDILDANVTTAKVADNAITGTKVADNLDIPDNNKIRFGTGNDLELYHDGTQSQITESGTGLLYINSNVAVIRNSSGNENQITAEANGSVGLYYDNSKKLNTEADGITVTGNIGIGGDAPNYQVHATTSIGVGAHGFNQQLTIDNDGIQSLVLGTGYTTLNLNQLGGNVDIANDSSKLRLGTGNDLQIYHDGSNSFITDAGTGSLKLATNELQLLNAAGNEYYLSGIENAATSLFYDNSKKLETTSAGVSFSGDTFMPDGESAHYGTGNDMYMGHSGSYSYIEDTSGDFRIHSNGLKLQSFTSGEKYIVCTHNGAVDLYYDNVLKFFTQSTGAALHNGAGNNRLLIHNSDYIQCGHSNNGLRLYNTSVNSEIQHTSTSGSFSIRGNALQLTSYTGTENYLVANKDGAVELYHDNSKKLETISTGIKVTGESGAGTGVIQLVHTDGRKNSIGTDFATNAYDSRIEFGISDGSTSGGTNRVASISYAGISFGSDTASANRLDDYEEGTFSATASSAGYTNAACVDEYYTKIGNIVHICFRLNVSSSASDADLTISGLPFSNSGSAGYCSVQWQDGAGFTIGGGRINGTIVERFGLIAAPNHSGNVNFYFQGTYRT